MQLDVVIEQRFYCCPQHKYWTDNAFPYVFWKRYLAAFTQVNIVARVSNVMEPQTNWKQVDGEGVTFIRLPSYLGPYQFLATLPRLFKVLIGRRDQGQAIIYRVPGIISVLYHLIVTPRNYPYGAEIVGDPTDVFAKGASKSWLRPYLKWLFSALLRYQCKQATATSYVTEYSLQQRYPPTSGAFSTHYSSIQLSANDYVIRHHYPQSSINKLVCIGNLSQPYKGCDFMLETLAILKEQGLHFELRWIGGGSLQTKMEALALKLGLHKNVTFLGNLAERKAINDELDKADFFVLCSRQEGLPRVLIEAMARSLVCVATDVGGVKELLPSGFIVERDNRKQLSYLLGNLAQFTEAQLLVESERNYHKSWEYENSSLAMRRLAMYQYLRDAH